MRINNFRSPHTADTVARAAVGATMFHEKIYRGESAGNKRRLNRCQLHFYRFKLIIVLLSALSASSTRSLLSPFAEGGSRRNENYYDELRGCCGDFYKHTEQIDRRNLLSVVLAKISYTKFSTGGSIELPERIPER